jgi:hypothetical protein
MAENHMIQLGFQYIHANEMLARAWEEGSCCKPQKNSSSLALEIGSSGACSCYMTDVLLLQRQCSRAIRELALAMQYSTEREREGHRTWQWPCRFAATTRHHAGMCVCVCGAGCGWVYRICHDTPRTIGRVANRE